MKVGSILIIVAIILISPFVVSAQLPGIELATLTISPTVPGPNQKVQARLSSSATDLDLAQISWSVNGQEIANGKGLKNFTFTTGNVGSATTLDVFMMSSDGQTFSQSLIINVANVSLLVESESYTPPFYRGKSYIPYQGRVRIIAVPSFIDENSNSIPSQNLVFKWKVDDRQMTDSSGVGKNVYIYKTSIPIRTKTIYVEVFSSDQKYVANGKVNITPTEPKVVLYENNPELGILYNKALTDPFNLNNSEITIAAVPYFFDTDNPNGANLKYDWNLNGGAVGDGSNSIVLKNPGGEGGRAILSLQLSNTIDYFQFASASLNINFGKAARNPFGL